MTQKSIFNLPIRAGQYTEQTERGATGQWYTMDKVRFRKGLAEKIGGWVQVQPQFIGICRRLKDWSSLDAKQWTAIGTDTKLYVWQDGTLYDITPLRRTVTLTAPFTTFTGETRVRVTDVNHGAQVGDYVTFSNAIVGGASGITVDGEYRVNTVIDVNNYEITDDETAATGGAGEGGTAVLAEYQISAGASSVTTATGYGTGPYGREGYGNARTGSTLTLGIRTWALDTWGEDLLASPRGGQIYWWDRSLGTGQRATALGGDAPISSEYMLVSQRDRHVLALGAYDYFNEAFDPLLIRWCSTEDLNDWVPTSVNTSGDLRLYSGSKIVTGVRSRLETVIFTDVSVHTLPFVGGFEVFGLNIVGENVSILGPNCAVPIDHRVMFMAESDFYIYDGIVQVLPCTVRNFVYDNLNVQQRDKIYGGLNREFNEVWWFYPSYDPEAWVQDDFSLSIPTGYEIADASTAPTVVFQNNWEGTQGATTDVEQSSNAATCTRFGLGIIDTARSRFGSSSAYSGSFEGGWSAPDIAAYDLGSGSWVIEGFINMRQLPANDGVDEWSIVNQWGAGGNAFAINFIRTGGVFTMRIRLGGTTQDIGVTNTTVVGDINAPGTWYHVVVERIGNTVYVGFNGFVEGSFGYSSTVPTSTEPLRFHDDGNLTWATNMWIDESRIGTGGVFYNLDSASTYTVPTSSLPAPGAGGTGDVGYSMFFNSAGFTEVLATADNNYEHDYFLINDEPILTPTQSEYAVELDVNPDIGAGTGRAGLCFLRTNLQGTINTDADDAQQLMAEIDYDNNQVSVWKKTSAGVAAPSNQGANTASFTTITGSAITTGQKYIITAQFNTPQVTIYVDGNQAFQFDLDATELTQFTTGTAGLHQTPGTTDDLYRFYNFAAGPVGVLTASDFDISPIEVNRYVALNYEEGTWITGRMARTAWADRSPLLEKPYAAAADGYLYQHETGTDENGSAMAAFIESYDMEIPEAGENLMHIDQLIPDFLELEGSVDVFLTGRKYPQDPNRISKGPYTVSTGTRKLSTRMRARQVALRIESDANGDRWRMGVWRARAGAHGRRG